VLRQHLKSQFVVGTVVSELQQQIAGMTSTKRASAGTVVCLQQPLDGIRVVNAIEIVSRDLKQVVELRFVWVTKLNSILNTSQERFIDQIGGLQIGRKDDELFERNLNLLPVASVR